MDLKESPEGVNVKNRHFIGDKQIRDASLGGSRAESFVNQGR